MSSKIGSVDAYQGCGRLMRWGQVFKILSKLVAQNEWMSVNDCHELRLKCWCPSGRERPVELS
jgi:hypothetical protein